MALETRDIRKNSKILLDDGHPYSVVEFEHVKPGKGNAFSRLRLRNLITGQVLESTFKSGSMLQEPNIETKNMQYLYPEGDMLCFMDNANYDQLALPKKALAGQEVYLTDNMEVQVLFFNDKPVNVDVPNFVELPIEYTEPGFKGDTATGASKIAKLKGGHELKVPLHLKEGDLLKVDTRTGEYVEKINR